MGYPRECDYAQAAASANENQIGNFNDTRELRAALGLRRMKPRRILHILSTAELAGTAIFQMVEALATVADKNRFQIDICFLRPGPLLDRVRNRGVEATCVNWSASARDVLGMSRYTAQLRSAEYHILHQHVGGRLLTSMGSRLTPAKIILHLHGRTLERNPSARNITALPPSDAVVANSRAMAEHFAGAHARVIYPGIDTSAPALPPTPHAGVVLGTACRLESVKQVAHLIQAMPALVAEFKHLRLEIAGDGSLRSRLEQESRQLGVADHVVFLGWRSDLPAVLSGWDIFAMPSHDEGFGVAALEAMAAGLPVVANSVGGLNELIDDGRTGFLVPPEDSARFLQRLRHLILDRPAREQMGAAARARATQHFPLARAVEQTLALYDELLSSPRVNIPSK